MFDFMYFLFEFFDIVSVIIEGSLGNNLSSVQFL